MSSLTPALRRLEALADTRKAQQHPNLPAYARVKAKYSDKSANDLTRAVVDCFSLHGHFATRLQSTGTYRADISKYVASTQRAGMPDVFAIVQGRAVHVEIKMPGDRLSSDQKETIAALLTARAAVYVATTFEGFYAWFLALEKGEPLPFGPPLSLFDSDASRD